MGRIQQRQRVTNERNVSFDDTVAIPSGDASAENNRRTPRHNQRDTPELKDDNNDSPEVQEREAQQQPDLGSPQIPHIDPLMGFEPPDPAIEAQQEG
jgi:hypothetical protein